MTLPLWGQLEKAQDDDQTIDEAIASAISTHEADPEAHLGSGESLEMHKTEAVVDHPQGSILPDKISFSDLSFDTTFESLSGFTVSSGVTNPAWPGAIFDVYDGGGDLRTLIANLLGIIDSGDIDHNVLMDCYFSIDSEDYAETINAGLENVSGPNYYLGFRVDAGDIVGFARWGGSEHVTGSLGTVSTAEVVFVRVYYDYAGGVIYFYVNGVQVGTLQPGSAIFANGAYGIRADANTAESTVLRVYRITISRSLPV